MPFVKSSDGNTLHYAVHDYTDRWRQAPTIMLVHGFARSGEFWFNMVPYLARHFRVICPDLRGLGKSIPLSDPARTVNIQSYLDDLSVIADDAGAQTFHLAGESIGATLSLVYAGHQPKRIRSLSVIAPPVFANQWIRTAYAVGYPSWEEAIRTLGVENWARASNSLARFPANTDPAFLEWYTKELGKSDVEVVAAMVNFAGSADARPYLEKIEAPVLAIYPTKGDIASDEQEQLLRKGIKKLNFSHLRSPYQMLSLIEPAMCAQQILNFAAIQDGFVACD